VSRRARPPIRLTMVVVVALLIATGTALAATTSLKLSGPSGVTLSHNQNYMVRVSGSTSRSGARLYLYEGGQVRGGTAAISCYSTESSEIARYHLSSSVHVYLGSRQVHGAFSFTLRFVAAHPGPRSFCAYVASANGGTTYAHAALHWTNSST
jgi:hypothetical protein